MDPVAGAPPNSTRGLTHLHQDFGFRVSGFGFRVSGFGLRIYGFGFRGSG